MHTSILSRLTRLSGWLKALAVLGALCATAVAQAASSMPNLTVGYFKSANPETVGQVYKLFPANVHFSTVESGITAFQEMIGGSLQLAGGIGVPPLALALLKAMPLKVVDAEYTFRQDLVVSKSIKGPQDLVGKTIAVTAGTTGDQSFDEYLQRNHINPRSVKIVNMDGTSMLGAFRRGDISGGYIWDPVRSRMLAAGGHPLDTTVVPALIVASDAVIRKHPKAVQAYVCSIAKANDFILTHPKKTLDVLSTLLNGDRATAAEVYKARQFLSPEQSMNLWLGADAANLKKAIRSMLVWANAKSVTPVSHLPDPGRIIDTTFAMAAAHGACK